MRHPPRRCILLKALLAGKIGHCAEHEDSLTSDVFGVADYLNSLQLINRFLKRALASDGKSMETDFLAGCREFELQVWPMFTDGTEPDALIVGRNGQETPAAILLECKYQSDAWESGGDNLKEDIVQQEKYRSQLLVYGRNFVNSSFEEERIRLLVKSAHRKLFVYLTADYSLPREGPFVPSARELKEIGLPVCWLSWRDFSSALRQEMDSPGLTDVGRKRMMQDLLVGLEERRNLRRFMHLISGLSLTRRGLHPSALRSVAGKGRQISFPSLRGLKFEIQVMPMKFARRGM